MDSNDKTRMFSASELEKINIRECLKTVYQALQEKGYRPLDQLVGYLVSGDPSYITSHKDARFLIGQLERIDILEEIVSDYFKGLE